MILGIGSDLIEVERVRSKIEKENGFKEKIFSSIEIKYCESRPNKFECFAARFAAKEAFLKAASLGIFDINDLCSVEVSNEPSGKPFFILSGKIKEMAKTLNIGKIHLTISHIKEMASAVVVIESKQD